MPRGSCKTCLVVTPYSMAKVVIPNKHLLGELQRYTGGSVERLTAGMSNDSKDDSNFSLYCNEEMLLNNLPINLVVGIVIKRLNLRIPKLDFFGTVVFVPKKITKSIERVFDELVKESEDADDHDESKEHFESEKSSDSIAVKVPTPKRQKTTE